jgi:hypothetical protein
MKPVEWILSWLAYRAKGPEPEGGRMADDRRRWPCWTFPVLIGPGMALVAVALAGRESRADRITLRGGGQIRGKLFPDPQNAGRVRVLTESGKTPLSFQKAQILQVNAEPSVLDEYLERRDRLASTAEANYELGVWCQEHKLKDLAELHFEAAVKHDKSYEPAHQKLGHVLLGDNWLWGDELREAQGLVRYKGQWISKQEKDHRAAAAANSAEQAAWVRRLKLLRQSLLNGPDDRRRVAETQLLEIRDPLAVSPLLQVFGSEVATLRTLLDRVLEGIPGPEAAGGLVTHILLEPDTDVRHVTIDALSKRKEPNVISGLTQALGSKDPSVVNRAAWSLGQLNAITTVPKLIPALITIQNHMVMPPIQGWPSGSAGTSFGSVAPTPGLTASYLNNGASPYGMLTPPGLGPGVSGYGVAGIPGPSLPTATFSSGGNGPREQMPRIITLRFQNVEVLSTLVKLTGQDFGYDIPAWQRWVSSGFHPDPTPVRRVPQP